MYIYANDTRFLQGPIKARNVYENEFASDLIEGKDVLITVEMYTDDMDDFSITIKDVNQGIPNSSAFRGWQDALNCQYDVNCSEGNGWSLQRDATAYVLFDGQFDCSGTLINNIHADLKPLVLSALHCANNDGFSSASIRFKYEASVPKCSGNSTGNQGPWITYGSASERSSFLGSDMILLELNGSLAGIKDMALAGWSRSTSVPSSGRAIGHPAGDTKKITVFSSSAIAVNGATYPFGFHDVWEVVWDKGLTEGGFSGGAPFDQNKRIVGQLTGSPNTQNCSTIDPTPDFGRMDRSWTGDGTNSGRLSNWLHDKSGTPPTTLNGIRVPYINPYTTEETVVCTSNKTFSLINSISGRSVTWAVSNTSLFGSSTSGSGTSATLRAASSTSQGTAVLTYTLTKSGSPTVTVTRDIWVGKPKLDFAKVNGSTSSGYSVVYPPAKLTVGSIGTNSTASWSRTSGSGNIYPNGNACLVYHNNFATVEASSSNSCGSSILHTFILDDPSLSPISEDDVYFRNPTDGITEIDLSEIDVEVNSISIFTSDFKLLRKLQNISKDYITIDLTGNISGLYFITFETEDQVITKKLIKN